MFLCPLFDNAQHGFLQGRSTVTQLLPFDHSIVWSLNRGPQCLFASRKGFRQCLPPKTAFETLPLRSQQETSTVVRELSGWTWSAVVGPRLQFKSFSSSIRSPPWKYLRSCAGFSLCERSPAGDTKLNRTLRWWLLMFQCHWKFTRLWVAPKGPRQPAWLEW